MLRLGRYAWLSYAYELTTDAPDEGRVAVEASVTAPVKKVAQKTPATKRAPAKKVAKKTPATKRAPSKKIVK